MRGKLAVLDGLVRLGIPHSGFINVKAETEHHERYDYSHHHAGFFVRRIFAMVEFLQIGHCCLPDYVMASPFPNSSRAVREATAHEGFIACFAGLG